MMTENEWEEYKNQSTYFIGKDISHVEAKRIYKSLLEQHDEVAHGIVDSIDRNDYVEFTRLITKRKQVQSAIDEMQSLYSNELCTSHSFSYHIFTALRKSAQMTEEKGEELLLTISNTLNNVNQSTYSIASKALDTAASFFGHSNRLTHRAGRNLVQQTSIGLLKLADLFKNK